MVANNSSKMSGSHREATTKEHTRREQLAKYFYDISKIICAGMVVGIFPSLLSGESVHISVWSLSLGTFATIVFALMTNRVLTY